MIGLFYVIRPTNDTSAWIDIIYIQALEYLTVILITKMQGILNVVSENNASRKKTLSYKITMSSYYILGLKPRTSFRSEYLT